ncbi:MAG: lysylphosphatidylglycerol synthase transmembrane domain-containing protein [Bacteroidota bacterium]
MTKGTFVVLLVFLLWKQIVGRSDAANLWENFTVQFTIIQLPWIAGAILLMPLNWALETLKWRNLVLPFESISFWRAYRAVLAGASLAIISPQRVGDLGGRILLVSPAHQSKAVMATLICNWAQLLVLIVMGIGGVLLIIPILFDYRAELYWSTLLVGLLIIGALGSMIYWRSRVVKYLLARSFFKKWPQLTQPLELLRDYNNRQIAQTVLWATMRYLTYSLQYYCLLQFFGIAPPIVAAFGSIATIFLVQTSIPLPALIGVLARGEIAILMWTQYGATAIEALSASYFLFIINLIVPSLMGMVIILKLNILKSLGYEKKSH